MKEERRKRDFSASTTPDVARSFQTISNVNKNHKFLHAKRDPYWYALLLLSDFKLIMPFNHSSAEKE